MTSEYDFPRGLTEAEIFKIKELMAEKGLDKEQLSETSEISERTISNAFNGHRIAYSTIKVICQGLGITVKQLVMGEVLPEIPQGQTLGEAIPPVIRLSAEQSGIEEPPGWLHLVIYVFQVGTAQEKKVTVKQRLLYRESSDSSNNLKICNSEHIETISLDKFPECLDQLVQDVASNAPCFFPGTENSWQIIIYLYLPVNLLAAPLAQWSGKYDKIVKENPLVLGCSDRFNYQDAKAKARSATLQNSHRQGWERLKKHTANHKNQHLSSLEWLHSEKAQGINWENYSGFRCQGKCLTPDPQNEKNWLKLIQSGIPLAIWQCSEENFENLTESHSVDFLARLAALRATQFSSEWVGVLYENPLYTPHVPPPQSFFFSFPGT